MEYANDRPSKQYYYWEMFPLHQLEELYDLYEGKKEQFTPEKLKEIIKQVKGWAITQVDIVGAPDKVLGTFLSAVEMAMVPACFTVASCFGKNALMDDIPKSMWERIKSARDEGREAIPDLKTDKDFYCVAGYAIFNRLFKRIKAALKSKDPVFELEGIAREIAESS